MPLPYGRPPQRRGNSLRCAYSWSANESRVGISRAAGAGLTTMSHVPLPVRVAVGLVVTAVEQARKLPEQLVDLPVTAASRAVQAGMRMQQRVTELAIKGDQVFSLLQPVEDTAPWARFDEDDEPPNPGTEAGAGEPANAGDGVSARPSARAGARPDTAQVDEADVAQALTPSHASTDGTRPAVA